MGCLLALIALISARFAFFLTWIFSDKVDIAFDGGFLAPFIGLLFLPWTALAWTFMYAPIKGVTGFGWFVVFFAFLIDLGSYTSGERARRARRA
jgi:hypothetical protein